MTLEGSAAGPIAERFADDGSFPNSGKPLLLYRAAIATTAAGPEAMEALFAANGWRPGWRSTIFTYDHYHSTAHEALGIAAGTARLLLGGPRGREFEVAAGDVVVIPAGVAHRRLSSGAGFLVVGAYPPGQSWDLLRGDLADRPHADQNIAKVPLPETDPVTGGDGPLRTLWGGAIA